MVKQLDQKHIEPLRERCVKLFPLAYPNATRDDAFDWRCRVVGKGSTSDWTVRDWVKAVKALEVKLGPKMKYIDRKKKDRSQMILI